ncbi:MAG: hypothetical protein AAB378_03390 [Patescibacteria group bacterium]
MPRSISNKQLFWSLDIVMIAQEERRMRMALVAEKSDCRSRGQQKELELREEEVPMENHWFENVIGNDADAMEMESLPSFEPRHQIFRMHGVIVRKDEKMHESHGPRGREKKLLCDRRQTIRHDI